MGLALNQVIKVGAYVVKQQLKGVKRYPLVLMLEPLFKCNLACSGCGKIDYPNAARRSFRSPAASRCCIRKWRRS